MLDYNAPMLAEYGAVFHSVHDLSAAFVKAFE
jgi:hypothetical protein